ncbi:uncharacterized protein [Euwallacea fornicatus]|uniref:uncharacterized protein n=1 Tax=Euwallacea fornicatus TaxID=995702 RepID=UPI0033902495
MGVTLHVITGLLLVLVAYTSTEERALRQIREAPPPSTTPSQNVTEINNRDLNKIVKTNPKTETLEPKSKLTNNANIFEGFPLKLSNYGNGNDVHKSISNGPKEDAVKLDDKERNKNYNASKFWSSEIHIKDDNFTITQVSNTVTGSTVDKSSQINRHPTFDNNSDLTTPTTKLFDQKFKQTVESFHGNYQKLDENEFDDEPHDEDDEDEDHDEDLEVLMKKLPERSSFEFEKTKTIVNNETVSKNSIHKDLNIEQTKKVKYKNVYNETLTYGDGVKGDVDERVTPRITTVKLPIIPTRKSVKEATTPHVVVDNNIGSETIVSPKNVTKIVLLGTTTILHSTTTEKLISTTNQSTTTSTTPKAIIPNEDLTTEPATEKLELIKNYTNIAERTNEAAKNIDLLTETTTQETTTLIPQTTTTFETTTLDTTEELPLTTTIFELVISTSDNEIRTSKSLEDSIVAEQIIRNMSNAGVNSDKNEIKTESYRKNEIDITTVSTDKVEEATIVDGNIIKKDVTENITDQTTLNTVNVVVNEMATEPLVITTSIISTTTDNIEASPIYPIETEPSESTPTTTEFSFIHVNEPDYDDTTHFSDTLDSSLPYKISSTSNDYLIPRKAPSVPELEVSSSPIPSNVIVALVNDTTALDDPTTNPTTEHNVTSDDEEGRNKGKIAAIVISCVGAVCLILLAGLLYIMKKRQKRLNYGPRCRPVTLDDYSIDNLSVYNSIRRKGGARMSKRSFGNPAFDDPVAPTHPLNFPALAKFSKNFEDIKAEFEDIPQIIARTSELPEGCDTKNRYANVIPLPETRVYLTPIDGYANSDYINASYVTGPNNTKGYYIATQGPMQNTVDDFWRMVWEQQAKVILMLTHLVENGLEKCVDYLPLSEVLECSRMFGDFQVTLKRREVKEKYIISGLQLKNMVSNSWREVMHFWYLGWPDKGVPMEANSLIAFIIEARSYMKSGTSDNKNNNRLQNGVTQTDHNPVIIHCSPGTGRTGVVIASDIAIREFEKTRLVDIPKIVHKIRRDRANAVQTKEQYIFIYKVVSLYAAKLTGGALENL